MCPFWGTLVACKQHVSGSAQTLALIRRARGAGAATAMPPLSTWCEGDKTRSTVLAHFSYAQHIYIHTHTRARVLLTGPRLTRIDGGGGDGDPCRACVSFLSFARAPLHCHAIAGQRSHSHANDPAKSLQSTHVANIHTNKNMRVRGMEVDTCRCMHVV